MGFELDLENPMRFTEKIQWRKLYDTNDIYAVLSDKYAVRAWVEKKIGAQYLIPLLETWDTPAEVSFQNLPQSFVLKTNNSCGTNILVDDKQLLDVAKVREELLEWMRIPFWFNNGFEMHYKKIKPVILAEKYMKPEDGTSDLTDYKFHCFRGKPVLCQVVRERRRGRTIDFFDMEWNKQDIVRILSNQPIDTTQKALPIPRGWNDLIEVAKKLSEGFAYVRVDLYEISGKVYFGEMTFTPGGGFEGFAPDEWDYKLGEYWDIHVEQVNMEQVGL